MSTRINLHKVPEEGSYVDTPPPSPYLSSASSFASASTSTFHASATTTVASSSTSSSSASSDKNKSQTPQRRKPSSRAASDASTTTSSARPQSTRRVQSSSAVSISNSNEQTPTSAKQQQQQQQQLLQQQQQKESTRQRDTPVLSHQKNVSLAPATIMHWSKAPVYGSLPLHNVRAHSVTLVDHTAWMFGGCDERECWRDLYTFDTETMQWSRPSALGDTPPRCRAHTATLVDRKIVVFGGGQGSTYYNTTHTFDIITRRWTAIRFPSTSPLPAPRRAHTAVVYDGRIWIFGGGNGVAALNDVWTLDLRNNRMRWEQIQVTGKERPTSRGYHTANAVGNVMIVVGGSDGKECFSDVWCFNMDTYEWTKLQLKDAPKRLSHTATQVGSCLFIIGGHDGTEYKTDLLCFNLVSLLYESRPTLGKPPTARGYHAAVLADSRLFVFGGFNGHTVHSDVHHLDLAAAAYLPQVTSFAIDVDVNLMSGDEDDDEDEGADSM